MVFTLIFVFLIVAAAAEQNVPFESAWVGDVMRVNVANVVGRSDIVLGRPNQSAAEALPLGNGRLGVAVWSEDGFTAQLNRADTMPYRYATGQVVIPGLAVLTAAPEYEGRLNLYDGAFEESGGGMRAVAYLQPGSDVLIVDVSGADPNETQTAFLKLWAPRNPQASANGTWGALAESWVDDKNPGSSSRTFGSLSAITAEGRSVSAVVVDARTIAVKVMPGTDGRFRILVASPSYRNESMEPARMLLERALTDRSSNSHLDWWHEFWHRANMIKVSSRDGSGEYMENLRNIYLFTSAGESGGEFPGSQAGVADLFSSVRDEHQWDPSAFWHWNLRMQVAANLGAGLPELNKPYFNLYRSNLANIREWTKQRMRGAAGICIPETMRFNGKGIEYETWLGTSHDVSGWNCDASSAPYYNARTLSTGAEVSLWIWQQYLATDDKVFLKKNFPVMAESARFLLSYEKAGSDGLKHTSPSNAHETQWDVTDPTTDLAARQALYAATIQAATILHQEAAMVAQLRAAIPKIPQLPRSLIKTPTVLLKADEDGGGEDMIATSSTPGATIRNVENIGLEPVWPYDLIGDTSPLFKLAQRTYFARSNKGRIDWSYDPVQAARLRLGSEVCSTLIDITQANQTYINGFAHWGGSGREFYIEQVAMVALGLQEALVQDYDGVIRIAPAIPTEWDFDGSVAVRKGTKVDVQVRGGAATTVGLEVKIAQPIRVRSPWPGEALKVINAKSGAVVLTATLARTIEFSASAGVTYRILRVGDTTKPTFVPIDGQIARSMRRLGTVQIGLEGRRR